MPKFRVYGIVPATKYLGIFEAETPEAAKELALNSDANDVSICHYCADSFDLDDCSCHEAVAELEDE